MATRKKNTEQADGQENQAMEKNMENAEAVSESETQETDASPETVEQPSESETSTNDAMNSTETAPKAAMPDVSNSDVASGVEPFLEDSTPLEKLNVLADRFRVPSWQQAALLRYTGWMDDKLVPEDEYRRELENLKNRRIGGGRR